MIIVRSSSSKSSIDKISSSTRKRKTGVFTFLQSEERFRKAVFSYRVRGDGKSNRRNKAAFSKFHGAV